jgi:hypothetical protein
MSENTSVIQTTLYEHTRLGHAIIDAEVALLRLTKHFDEDKIALFEKAAWVAWNHCTNAILREGNCRFEREG